MRLEQAGEPGQQAEIAVGQEMHGTDVDAQAARGLGVAAHRGELAAGGQRVIRSQVARAARAATRIGRVIRTRSPFAASVCQSTTRVDHQSGRA